MTAARVARARMVAQRIWQPVTEPEDVVARLTAMQSQEHRYARWSVAQRSGATATDVDRAFDAGRILRTHVLRPTWHYVTPVDIRWLVALSGPIIDRRNERRYAELGLDARARADATDAIAREVAERPLTRRDLAQRLEARGIPTGGQRLPYLLMHAELHGAICSGPMEGRQHTYAAFDDRVPPAPGPRGDEALAELARRYFTTRGPATVRDFAWWGGLPAGDANRAVALLGDTLERTTLEGRTYLGGDAVAPPAKTARVDLVQCYDEIIISYTQSRDVLASAGIAFPVPGPSDGFSHVALLDGRLLGHWRVAPSSAQPRVETRLRRDLEATEQRALVDAIARHESFLAPSPPPTAR